MHCHNAKAAGESDDDTGSDDHGRSSGSDGKLHNMSDLRQSDNDNVFLCSSDDSDVEMDPGTSGKESGALKPLATYMEVSNYMEVSDLTLATTATIGS